MSAGSAAQELVILKGILSEFGDLVLVHYLTIKLWKPSVAKVILFLFYRIQIYS